MQYTTSLLLIPWIISAGVANAQSFEQIERYERRIEEQQQLDAMREELEAVRW